jgi:hypothetical protein
MNLKNIKNLVNNVLGVLGLEVIRLVRHVPKFPVESSEEDIRLLEDCLPYSMTNPIRMWALLTAIKHVEKNQIAGDFVECGVWKGGCLALMMKAQAGPSTRTVFGFDTFSGMTDPGIHDVDIFSGQVSLEDIEKYENKYSYPGKLVVEKNLADLDCNTDVRLIEGDVALTLKNTKNLPSKISILRLDTDFYESTKVELEVLFPLLSDGGILIIDDYGHYEGARRAVDEYFRGKNYLLHYVDYTCRLVVKSSE